VFLSVNNHDKPTLLPIAQQLAALGLRLVATRGTAKYLRDRGLMVESIHKVNEGRPNDIDLIINGEINLIINTPFGGSSFRDEHILRATAIAHGVPMVTTLSAAKAATRAITALVKDKLRVKSLQEYWEQKVETA